MKDSTLLSADHLNFYRSYLTKHGLTYNDPEDLFDQLDYERKCSIEFDDFVHRLFCLILNTLPVVDEEDYDKEAYEQIEFI